MRPDSVPRRQAIDTPVSSAGPAAPAPRDLSGSARQGGPRRADAPNFVLVWIVVSSLWTLATGLRMQRTWMPGPVWPDLLGKPLAWISVFLPPLLFAIILLAVKRVATARYQQDR